MVYEFLNDGFLKLSTHRLFGNRNTASYKKAARKLLPRKPNNPLIITLSPTSLPSQEFFCYLNFPVSSFKYIESIHKTLLNKLNRPFFFLPVLCSLMLMDSSPTRQLNL